MRIFDICRTRKGNGQVPLNEGVEKVQSDMGRTEIQSDEYLQEVLSDIYLACVPRAPIFRFRVGRGWLQCLRNKSVTVHITCMRLAMTMHLDALELSGFWLL